MEKDRWSEKKKGERGGEEGMVEAERTEREREQVKSGGSRKMMEKRERPPAFSTSLHLISNRHQTTR